MSCSSEGYGKRKVIGLWHISSTLQGARSKFWGVAGSEDFACATLPTIPLDFQDKIKNFCHPTLLKIRFKITVTPPSRYYGASINSNGLLTL